MVLLTLDRMARGGIRDHLAAAIIATRPTATGSFRTSRRCSTTTPSSPRIHLAAFEITKDPRWRTRPRPPSRSSSRSMTAPEGGFYSALDAETKGEEGAYYVWTRDEVKAALGEGADAELFAAVYGLDGEPNAEGGHYVLHEPRTGPSKPRHSRLPPEQLEAPAAPSARDCSAAREKRPAPLRDDKVLSGWNGLMIAAYADGYRVLKVREIPPGRRKGRRLPARQAADHRRAACCERIAPGKAKLPAYLEDYAFLVHGLLRLHAATGDAAGCERLRTLADRMIADFEDSEEGGFFFTADGHESLLARAKDPFDNALPSGNSMAILDLIALHRSPRNTSYLDHAGKALATYQHARSRRYPAALPLMLLGLSQYLDERPEVAQ